MTYQEFAMDLQEVDDLWDCDLKDTATQEAWRLSPDNPANIETRE